MCTVFERGSDIALAERLCAETDGDGDGVDDAVDLCPAHAETKNGIADGDGCPDPDLDEDLFLDFEDACPDAKGGFPDGCPVPDSDHDGLADHLDACPNRAEDIDGEYDSDGCPEGERKLRASEQLVVWKRARVDVRRGKERPTENGARALAELVDGVDTRVGQIVKVHVVGWAGLREVGKGAARDLAQRRVEVVRDAFLAAGLPPSRFLLEARPLKGKGARKTGYIEVEVTVAELKPGATEDVAAESGATGATSGSGGPEDGAAPTDGSGTAPPPPPPDDEKPPPIDSGDDDDWDAAVLGG